MKVDGVNFWYRPVGATRTLITYASGSTHCIENHVMLGEAKPVARHLTEAEVVAWLTSIVKHMAPLPPAKGGT